MAEGEGGRDRGRGETKIEENHDEWKLTNLPNHDDVKVWCAGVPAVSHHPDVPVLPQVLPGGSELQLAGASAAPPDRPHQDPRPPAGRGQGRGRLLPGPAGD